ncbi:MAG: heavy metal-associated domain-containing protein [Actinomycetota bacterium]|nr:heavy metal-associated domain-containing protein [Actinomycetota bacterium]MDP2287319.1 heavy metal-associated domain-containing protein [Actinomycetota bacterium]
MKTYAITGMTCANCVRHVTEAIESVDGVTGVRVDLDSASAEVHGEVSAAALADAVREAGYSLSA